MNAKLRTVGLSLAVVSGSTFLGGEVAQTIVSSTSDQQALWDAEITASSAWSEVHKADGASQYIGAKVGETCVRAVEDEILDLKIEDKPVVDTRVLSSVTESGVSCSGQDELLVSDLVKVEIDESRALSEAMSAGRTQAELVKEDESRHNRWRLAGAIVGGISPFVAYGAMAVGRRPRRFHIDLR
jgi:uncharacterized protein YbdZ (MbtH family)